jgi:hypothetical protein
MTTPPLAKASLIPFGDPPNANQPDAARAIPFDFNPETLTLKVSSGEARDAARRGRQQTQNVGASQATLSFDCLFDSTRPRSSDGPGSENGSVERRDVRRRTKAIADLLQVTEPGRQPTPRRVRFLWGSFSFDGVVSQHQELFDYFSAEGVPLRSKVTLTLTEKDFRYDVTAEQAAPLRDGAATLGSGSGAADAPPSIPPGPEQRREAALAAILVPGVPRPSAVQIGRSFAAGIPLQAREALALFGSTALPAGAALPRAIQASSSGLTTARTISTAQPGRPTSPWGRDAAPAGSAAAGLAGRVVAQRQAGLDPGPAQRRPSDKPQAPAPTPPITGHARLRPRLALEPDPRLFPLPLVPERSPLERRPRWEAAPAMGPAGRALGAAPPSLGSAGGCACGCGCIPCRGAKP